MTYSKAVEFLKTQVQTIGDQLKQAEDWAALPGGRRVENSAVLRSCPRWPPPSKS